MGELWQSLLEEVGVRRDQARVPEHHPPITRYSCVVCLVQLLLGYCVFGLVLVRLNHSTSDKKLIRVDFVISVVVKPAEKE